MQQTGFYARVRALRCAQDMPVQGGSPRPLGKHLGVGIYGQGFQNAWKSYQSRSQLTVCLHYWAGPEMSFYSQADTLCLAPAGHRHGWGTFRSDPKYRAPSYLGS